MMVHVDISGRINGNPEVKRIATGLLSKFKGAANNDLASHLSVLREIESGSIVDGPGFFPLE